MKFIVAPDKFKGSMKASEAALQIEKGLLQVIPRAEIIKYPLSDGGEGLVEALSSKPGSLMLSATVTGPAGRPVEAAYGLVDEGKTGVIEMAAASGLALLNSKERDPRITTTRGTGELIKAALDQGCQKLIIGIGGSATNDGGAGMARALGVKFFNSAGKHLTEGGAALQGLAKIDTSGLDPRIKKSTILVACDVDNPLTGPQGASRIYGPQKGATEKTVEELDRALKNYARVLEKDLGAKVENTPGAGAAGGLGAGLIAFLKAHLVSGIELVLETLEIEKHLPGCNLLITGEGKLDAQSVYGKAPIGVARKAKEYRVPVIALSGQLEGKLDLFHREGILACFAISDGPITLEESMEKGPYLLQTKTAELLRLWNAARLC